MDTTTNETETARTTLRDTLPEGSAVYTITTVPPSYGRSGHARYVRVLVPDGNAIRDITWLVARAIGGRLHLDRGGIHRGGGGYSASDDVVHALSRALHGTGYSITDRRL